jgi:hypothetical protein
MSDAPVFPPAGFVSLLRAMDRQAAQDRAWAASEAENREEDRFEQEERAAFVRHCQSATLIAYTTWMIGWLRLGNEPSHVYEYPFTRVARKWMVLGEQPEYVPALYGSFSLHVIVPMGVDFTPQDLGDCGHSTFYFMDDFQVVSGLTPVYSDMLPVLASAL